jgi:dCMP deaminase
MNEPDEQGKTAPPFALGEEVSLAGWDLRFLELALFVGQWSKDRSRKVGCVIVDAHNSVRSVGYNGFPRGIHDDPPPRHERPAKYLWTEHAERNAIYQAARMGVGLQGTTMYLPWFPCMDCARAIVQAGITKLIAYRPDISEPQWGDQFVTALELLREADIKLVVVKPLST